MEGSASEKMIKRFPIFAYPHFLKLWGGQIFEKNAEHLLNFFFVLRLHDLANNPFLTSILVISFSIPPILFSNIAGVIADSFDRRKIFLTVNIFRILLVLASITLINTSTGIIISALILSAAGEFLGPTHNASIPSTVRQQHLFLANTISSLTSYGSFLIGFSLAGPLYFYANQHTIYGIAIFLHIVSLGFYFFLPPLARHLKELKNPTISLIKNYNIVFNRIIHGIRFIRQRPMIMTVIILATFVFTIERAFVSLMPSFSEELLKFTAKDISLFLIIPTGVGAVIGALSANRLNRTHQKINLITFGILCDGIGLLLVALYPIISSMFPASIMIGDFQLWNLAYIMGLAILSGIADPFVIITTQTLLQEQTPAATRGRVFGSLLMIMNIMEIIPVMIIGGLATLFPIARIIMSLGLLTLMIGAVGKFVYHRFPVLPPQFDESDFVK